MRIVLAYSGGLDTSVAIPWLAEKYGAEIVAVTMDLGQGRELDDVRERALAVGAVRAHVLDVREEFARDFILPALQAGAVHEGRDPLAAALGRPLIANHLVEIARLEDADAIAIAPTREWGVTRPQAIAYARERGIPVPATVDSPYRTDANLWGRSIACGILEDPWQEPPDDLYTLTASPADAPARPAYVEIEFQQGVPMKVNGVSMGLVELIQSLTTIAGDHGVGRIDVVENRPLGIKFRRIHEAPAAVALRAAHRDLQTFVTPRDLERLTSELAASYADLVHNGLWYTPTRDAIDALVARVQERVTGTIRLRLFKGDCRVVGRRSPFALSGHDLATPDDLHGRVVSTSPTVG
jgi:argininosuccinate synthase